MSIEGKLVKKIHKRSRWSKYRERTISSSTFDKAEKTGKTIYDSNRIFKLLRSIQRKFDKVFGINVIGDEPLIRAEVNFATLARYDFGSSDYGIKATLASGQARGLGIVPGDVVFILEGDLKGFQLEVITVDYSTDILRLEDTNHSVIAGVKENTEIVCIADTGEYEVTSIDCLADDGAYEQSSVVCVADLGAYEAFTVTCPTGAAAAQADYFVLEAPNGQTYAYWLDIDAAGTTPTGAAYVAATNKVKVSILSTDSAIQVGGKLAAAVVLANATTTDNGDGTVSIAYTKMGAHPDATPHNADDTGAGSISIAMVTQGAASNLNSKYFTISSALDAVKYYVWFNVGSEGVDPLVAGRTGIEIDLLAGASNVTVATEIKTSLDLVPTTPFTVIRNTATLTITNTLMGDSTDTADGTAATGFTISTVVQGNVSSLNSSYFLINSAADAVEYYVWFNVGTEGVDPAVGTKTGVEIAISAGATDVAVATAIKSALDLLAGTPFATVRSTANLVVTNTGLGVTTDAVDGTAPTGFTISVTNQGVDSNLNSKYFLINSALDATEYYVWLNVASEGIDPAPAGKTAIPVAIAASAADTAVALAVKTALDANPDFVDLVSLDTVDNANVITGATTDASDVDTGFSITVTQQGVTYNPLLPSETNDRARILYSAQKGQYK